MMREKMNEKSITDAARWIVDQHSQKKNYANLPESFGIGGLEDAYLVQQEVVAFFPKSAGQGWGTQTGPDLETDSATLRAGSSLRRPIVSFRNPLWKA